jgi:hypothetical protein
VTLDVTFELFLITSFGVKTQVVKDATSLGKLAAAQTSVWKPELGWLSRPISLNDL